MQPATRFATCFLLIALVTLYSPKMTERAFSLFSEKFAPKQDSQTTMYYQKVVQDCYGPYARKAEIDIALSALHHDIDPWQFQKLSESVKTSKFAVDCITKKIKPEI